MIVFCLLGGPRGGELAEGEFVFHGNEKDVEDDAIFFNFPRTKTSSQISRTNENTVNRHFYLQHGRCQVIQGIFALLPPPPHTNTRSG